MVVIAQLVSTINNTRDSTRGSAFNRFMKEPVDKAFASCIHSTNVPV